ncbi:FIG048548: ATP synthase protein I2 [hydrothermal vent metagenome]|uniref:FIG048548: ATP synthase protein I2 n=1 Tax=hydrothermal vent metagenome TaxID=652676 RepID=A0A1W1CW81_9ZZZZ
MIALVVLVVSSELKAVLSVIYGGCISLNNSYLNNRILKKQKKYNISINASLGLMIINVVVRMLLVALFVLIGLKIDLNAFSLLLGFAIGQVGFLIDRVLIQNGG